MDCLSEPVQAHGDETLSDVVARIGRETASAVVPADDNHGHSIGYGHGHSYDIVLCADPHSPQPEWWLEDSMGEYGDPLDATQWLALRDTVVALRLGEVAVTFYRQRRRAGQHLA